MRSERNALQGKRTRNVLSFASVKGNDKRRQTGHAVTFAVEFLVYLCATESRPVKIERR